MKIRLDGLQYVLFPPENPQTDWRPLYEESFKFWQDSWSKTFEELEGNGRVYSDDFCRQNQIGAVTFEGKCVALGLFHELDFTLATSRSDSNFQAWPDQAIQKLIADGPRILVGSNLVVHPDYRGDVGNGLKLKDLMLGLMVKTLLATGCDAMSGTARVNRGVDEVAVRYGGTPVSENVKYHGVDVQLIAFYRRRVEKLALFSDIGVENLWRTRKELGARTPYLELQKTGENR